MLDAIGERMKEYEAATQMLLPRRLPIIVRVDGRAFHGIANCFQRPYDDVLRSAMAEVAKYLCSEIAGAKLAYTQSDEISILITNDDKIDTQPWFGNNLQKIVSLVASMATAKFNALKLEGLSGLQQFDARAFILPVDEVVNYFIWRQQDAARNSINMLGQNYFSPKELNGMNTNQIQEELWNRKGVNWNDTPAKHKRGVCVVRVAKAYSAEEINDELVKKGINKIVLTTDVVRKEWFVDFDIPIFTKDRNYIARAMAKEE